jgi:integrase/recombinase XerD
MAEYYLYRKKDENGKAYGPWWARKRRKGLPDQYFNCETDHKASAAKRAEAWHVRLVAAKFGEIEPHSFEDAAAETARRHFASLKYKSRMRYETVFNHGIAVFGKRLLSDVDSGVLADYEQMRREEGVKPNTIGLELRILGMVFKCAKKLKWHSGENPCRVYLEEFAAADIKTRITREFYLTHEMEEQILAVATDLWKHRMIFAIESGLRLEEWCSLLRRHVDLKRNEIEVLADVAKNHTGRKVPLTPRAKESFLWMLEKIPDSDFALPREDGERIAWNSPNAWRKLQHFAGAAWAQDLPEGQPLPAHLKFGPHWLRKTCGCRLLQDRRFPIERVSKWLGHKSIKVTQDSYAFLNIDHLQELVAETQSRVRRIGVTGRVTRASVSLKRAI